MFDARVVYEFSLETQIGTPQLEEEYSRIVVAGGSTTSIIDHHSLQPMNASDIY